MVSPLATKPILAAAPNAGKIDAGLAERVIDAAVLRPFVAQLDLVAALLAMSLIVKAIQGTLAYSRPTHS